MRLVYFFHISIPVELMMAVLLKSTVKHSQTTCNIWQAFFVTVIIYCERTFIRWHQFSWFLQNALIHGNLNSWFQTIHATINGKIVFRWIFIFVI
jgi:hypothetical protein